MTRGGGQVDIVGAGGRDTHQAEFPGGLQGGTIGFFADETSTRLPALTDTSRDMDFVDVFYSLAIDPQIVPLK